MKIENRSRKQSHKLDGIGVGRIRTFPFLPIPFTTPSLMIQWKLGCRSRKQKRKNQPIAKPVTGVFFRFCLRLRKCSFHLKDRKWRRYKQNQCSASDSVASENQPLQNICQNYASGSTKKKMLSFEIPIHDFHEQNTAFFLSSRRCRHRHRCCNYRRHSTTKIKVFASLRNSHRTWLWTHR